MTIYTHNHNTQKNCVRALCDIVPVTNILYAESGICNNGSMGASREARQATAPQLFIEAYYATYYNIEAIEVYFQTIYMGNDSGNVSRVTTYV